MNYKQKISEGILGLAIGDAAGVPYEFMDPAILKEHPATDMIEYGSHNQPKGTWSDDTSMALALMDALVKKPEYPDYDLIMHNFYRWAKDGEFTAGGKMFDIGRTCANAIVNYSKGADPLECGLGGENDCGNGGLMRILPLAFYLYRKYGPDFIASEEAVEIISDITGLTHAHPRCQVASGIYLSIAAKLLDGCSKEDSVLQGFLSAQDFYSKKDRYKDSFSLFSDIAAPNFKDIPADQMSGGMYVVDTFKASVWAFLSTGSYKDCVFKGINLGGDTDTIAAISGGLAGLYYGLGGNCGIPLEYIAVLQRADYILALCGDLAKALEDSRT